MSELELQIPDCVGPHPRFLLTDKRNEVLVGTMPSNEVRSVLVCGVWIATPDLTDACFLHTFFLN